MIETLLVAGLSGLVMGAFMLGGMRRDMKTLRAAMHTLHARMDALVIALAKRHVVDAGAVAHLARVNPR